LFLSYALTVIAQTLPPIITTPGNVTLAYVSVGCYNEANGVTATFSDLMISGDTTLTKQKCASLSASKGYNLFAIAFGQYCYGGLNTNYTASGINPTCHMNCAGDNSTLCGDAGAISVYKMYSYLGCYNEKNGQGAPAIADLMDAGDPTLTIANCANIALSRSYNTFALAGGQWCYGGLNPLYSQYNASTSCNTQCAGIGGGYGCGGAGANSVYTFYPIMNSTTTVSPTTIVPTTTVPTTVIATTVTPTTAVPTTINVTTSAPTTAPVTTTVPTTAAPTTLTPTTVVATTVVPTTAAPTTAVPTTQGPTTVSPTTVAPTTVAATTAVPTTLAPNTTAPTVHVNSTSACSSSTHFLCDAINPALPLYFSITVIGVVAVTTGVIGAISYLYGKPLSIAYQRLFSSTATSAV